LEAQPNVSSAGIGGSSGWSHNWQRGWSHAAGKTNGYLVPCRWQVTKLAHLAAWSHHANVHLAEHELPATTCNLNKTSVAIGGPIRVGDFDRWPTHQNRNLQAQRSRRGPEVPSPVRSL
jgi:hypothetical protein